MSPKHHPMNPMSHLEAFKWTVSKSLGSSSTAMHVLLHTRICLMKPRVSFPNKNVLISAEALVVATLATLLGNRPISSACLRYWSLRDHVRPPRPFRYHQSRTMQIPYSTNLDICRVFTHSATCATHEQHYPWLVYGRHGVMRFH